MKRRAGRTAHDYNQCKNGNGYFRKDCHHATAICSDDHLMHCIFYIDTNLVRAVAVEHL